MNRVESKKRAGSRSTTSIDVDSESIAYTRATSPDVEKRLRPKRAPGQTRGQRSPGTLPRLQQRLNHKRGSRHQVTLDQRSGNSQDAEAPARELPIASRVVSALPFVPRVPINLDDERGLPGEEVDDVIANHDLTPKLQAEQATKARSLEAARPRASQESSIRRRRAGDWDVPGLCIALRDSA
jgi:hypothetical protein